jgi:hypothetical protein
MWIAENLRRVVAAGGIPHVAMPAGAIPIGAMPAGAIPIRIMPAGAVPIRVMPAGPIPFGAIPAGAIPVRMMPAGPIPFEAIPAGAIPVRMMPAHGGGAPAGMEVPRIFVNHGGHIREFPQMRVEVQGNMPMINARYNAPDGRRMMWDAVTGRWREF